MEKVYHATQLPLFVFSKVCTGVQIEHVSDNCLCPGKRCKECQNVKCHQAFRSQRNTCRKCASEQQKGYYQEHKDYYLTYNKEYRQDHKEHYIDYDKHYQKSHNERINENRRNRYQRNGERRRQQNRHYARNHFEQNKQRCGQWRQSNWQWYLATSQVYCSVRRTRKTQAGGSYTVAEWQALKEKYNYTCLCCGKREPEIKLTADHVIPVAKHGSSHIDNIQPLCGICNASKGTKTTDYRLKWSEHL